MSIKDLKFSRNLKPMVLKPTMLVLEPKCGTNIQITPFTEPLPRVQIQGLFYSRTFSYPEPKTHNIGFRTQVWHQYPDISLYLNIYPESKFEVRFILGPLV